MMLKNIEFVVNNSNHVRINQKKLEKLAMCVKKSVHSNWFEKFKNIFTEKERVLVLFLCNSINFCFWNNRSYEEEYENLTYKGSEAIFVSLIKYLITKNKKINLKKIKKMKYDEFSKIFKQNLFLLPERYKSFMDTISIIENDFQSFYNEVFNIVDCENLLHYIVSNFSSFNDVSYYKGVEVQFYKRAIILVRDLYYNVNIIQKNIKNIDYLPGCADYKIPRFLYDYGVLEYSKELRENIMNNQEIPHNSNEEIEIRANMIYVIKIISDMLKDEKINMIEVDNILWNMSKKNIKSNHHRTISIYY